MNFNFYGLILGITFLGGYFYLKRSLLPAKFLDPLFTGLLFWGIIGARLYHVFDYWQYYSHNPLQILNLPSGGLGIFGGLVSGFIFLVFFCRRHHLSLLHLLNNLALYLPLAQSIGRWGNFFNHEIYSPSGHPLWLYESLACILLFILINLLKSKQRFSPFAMYLIGYGLIRIFLDTFRTDVFTISGFKISQILSVVFIILGLWILKKRLPLNR